MMLATLIETHEQAGQFKRAVSHFVSGLPPPRRVAKTTCMTPILFGKSQTRKRITRNKPGKYYGSLSTSRYASHLIPMKLITILFVIVAPLLFGSQLGLTTVTQPLYLHGSESEPRISLEPVPYVTSESDPEWRFSAICVPFVPPSRGNRGGGRTTSISLPYIESKSREPTARIARMCLSPLTHLRQLSPKATHSPLSRC